jgi:hypothetical protein
MSAIGYCYGNAFPESLFALIKSELLPEEGVFNSKPESYTVIFDYLEYFYNRCCFYYRRIFLLKTLFAVFCTSSS